MIDIQSMLSGIRSLQGELKDLARKIEALKRQREEIEGAPPPPDDFASMIVGVIDDGAREYVDALSRDMARYVDMPEERVPDQLQRILAATLGSGTGIGVGRMGYPAPDGCLSLPALWFLLSDTLRPKLEEALSTMPGYPVECGIPRSERPVAIAKLDKEIDELESREAKLLAEAEAAGLRPAE